MKQLLILFSIFFLSNSQISYEDFSDRRLGGSPYYHALGYSGLASNSKTHINIVNPAAWVYIPNTIFNLSIRTSTEEKKILGNSTNFAITNLEGINWVSTIMDSSLSIGLNIRPIEERNGQVFSDFNNLLIDGDINSIYRESRNFRGTLNQYKFSFAYRFLNNLSASFSTLYHSGNFIEEVKREYSSETFVGYNSELSKKYTGFGTEFSLFYKLNPKTSFSALFSPSVKLDNESKILTVRGGVDNTEIDFVSSEIYETPNRFMFGASHSLTEKGIFYIDFHHESWNNRGQNLNKYSIGYEIIGEKDIFKSIWKRSNYMFGAYHYTDVTNKDLIVYGLTAGISIPFNYDRNRLFISLGYGKKHDRISFSGGSSGIQLNIGLSLKEFWYLPESED